MVDTKLYYAIALCKTREWSGQCNGSKTALDDRENGCFEISGIGGRKRNVVESLEDQNKSLSTQISFTMSLKRQIKLLSESQTRQSNPHFLTLLQTNPQIFDKVVHEKTSFQIPLQDPFSVQFQRLRTGRSGGNRLQEQPHIQPRLVSVHHSLHQPHHRRSYRHLIR